MKVIFTVIILGLLISFFYQQLQLNSMKAELQLLSKKWDEVRRPSASIPETAALILPEDKQAVLAPENTDLHRRNDDRINLLESEISQFKDQISDVQRNVFEIDTKLYSLLQTPNIAAEPDDTEQVPAAEQRQLSVQAATNRQERIENELAYESINTNWATPMEDKITDAFTSSNTIPDTIGINATCKTTMCEVNISYTPSSEEDLLEFENELLVTLGESLSNVHKYRKTGSLQEGYSFSLIASP